MLLSGALRYACGRQSIAVRSRGRSTSGKRAGGDVRALAGERMARDYDRREAGYACMCATGGERQKMGQARKRMQAAAGSARCWRRETGGSASGAAVPLWGRVCSACA
eukprot:IDg17914t1